MQDDIQDDPRVSEILELPMSKDLEDQDGRRINANAEMSLPDIGGEAAEVPEPNA